MSDREGMGPGEEFVNYLVYNVERCNVSRGYEALDYLPPFVFEMDLDVSDGDDDTAELLVGSSSTVRVY